MIAPPIHRLVRAAAIVLSLTVGAAGLTGALANGIVDGVERPGAAYEVLKIDPPSPDACRQACMEDPRCMAYSYVKPGFQGGKARCWLKETVTPAWSSDCCMSGIKDYDTLAETETFNAITLTGADGAEAGLDLCRDGEHDCGWPTANAYCAQQGFSAAIDYRVNRESPPTVSLVDGKPCTSLFCHRIAQITCVAATETAE